jgi:hypothetical protein
MSSSHGELVLIFLSPQDLCNEQEEDHQGEAQLLSHPALSITYVALVKPSRVAAPAVNSGLRQDERGGEVRLSQDVVAGVASRLGGHGCARDGGV